MENNNVANVFKVIAIFSFVIGGIAGIGMFSDEKIDIASYIWIGCFIEGMLFYGFGEIINQAHLSNLKKDTIIQKLIILNEQLSQSPSANYSKIMDESLPKI